MGGRVFEAGSTPPRRAGRGPPRERLPTEEEIAASLRADLELARTECRTWEGATYLAPAAARRDDSGEVTSRFEEFGTLVELSAKLFP